MDVICTVNMFDKKQKIQYGNTTIEVDVHELPNTLKDICEKYNINKIHVVGNKNYIKGIIVDNEIVKLLV